MTTYRAYADEAYIEKAQLEEIRTMMDRADHIVRHLNHIDSSSKIDLKDFIDQLTSQVVGIAVELDAKIDYYEEQVHAGATMAEDE